MLSILIPTYRYDVSRLVSELRAQCMASGIVFEILVVDDASPDFTSENHRINSWANCSYEVLAHNIGRSRIRNLLASKAQYNWLLFLDSDTYPVSDTFISTYVNAIAGTQHALNGGILYTPEPPPKQRLLRWVYGRQREALTAATRSKNPYLAFLSLNFAMPKTLFESVRFDESLPNLRHEDTVFSFDLKMRGVSVRHIENPVFHDGLDTFDVMLRKEHEALYALKNLIDSNRISKEYVGMGKVYCRLKRSGLSRAVAFGFKAIRPMLLKNIASARPSLFLYDLYRIGYMCTL